MRGPETDLLYIGLGLPVFMEVIVRLAARRSAALFAEPWTVRVTDETFALRTAMSQAEIGWNAYREAWERSGFWYLRQISGAVCFVPKRVLDDAQQAELTEFFARRLPPPKIRWYNPAPGDKSSVKTARPGKRFQRPLLPFVVRQHIPPLEHDCGV